MLHSRPRKKQAGRRDASPRSKVTCHGNAEHVRLRERFFGRKRWPEFKNLEFSWSVFFLAGNSPEMGIFDGIYLRNNLRPFNHTHLNPRCGLKGCSLKASWVPEVDHTKNCSSARKKEITTAKMGRFLPEATLLGKFHHNAHRAELGESSSVQYTQNIPSPMMFVYQSFDTWKCM